MSKDAIKEQVVKAMCAAVYLSGMMDRKEISQEAYNLLMAATSAVIADQIEGVKKEDAWCVAPSVN